MRKMVPGDSSGKQAAEQAVNRCPVEGCGLPQFRAPNGGFSCASGHGFGDANGPEAAAAPLPAELKVAYERELAERARREPPLYELRQVGGKLTVTLGAQKFAPVQYHSFDVGPYTAEVVLGPGESLADAHGRAMAELREVAERDYQASLKEFLLRVKVSADAARRGR